MTSLSVIMAVMVINLYERGNKSKRAPEWLKTFVLNWLAWMLRMTHDMDRLAKSIRFVRLFLQVIILKYEFNTKSMESSIEHA